jgi:hypothetical protein
VEFEHSGWKKRARFHLVDTLVVVPSPDQLSASFAVKAPQEKPSVYKRRCVMLQGIRVIKFFGWESAFTTRIASVRLRELVQLRGLALLKCASNLLMQAIPTMVCVTAVGARLYARGTAEHSVPAMQYRRLGGSRHTFRSIPTQHVMRKLERHRVREILSTAYHA